MGERLGERLGECKVIEFNRREKQVFTYVIRWFKKNFELRDMKISVYPLDTSHRCDALTSSDNCKKVAIFIKPGMGPKKFRSVFIHEMLHVTLNIAYDAYLASRRRSLRNKTRLGYKNRWRVLDEKLTCLLTHAIVPNWRRASSLTDISDVYYEEDIWNR